MNSSDHITVSTRDYVNITHLLQSPTYQHLSEAGLLQKELAVANVLELSDVPPTLVTMNSTVTLVDDNTNTRFSLTLVYPGPNHVSDAVSLFSPIGSALLGASVGKSIVWQSANLLRLQLRIEKVVFKPTASGHFLHQH